MNDMSYVHVENYLPVEVFNKEMRT